MALFPERFRKSGVTLANYDFFDIASGTGLVTFYAGMTSGAIAGADYSLSNNQFWSQQLYTEASTADGNYALVSDLDFDVDINRPLIVDGKCIVNIPIAIQKTSGTSGNGFAEAWLIKYDGSTETNLAQASGGIWTAAAGATAYNIDAVLLDLPKTTFKVGDVLRLNIKAFGRNNGGGTMTTAIGHDPKNRSTLPGSDDWGSTPTNLILQLPVKIDI